MGWVRIRLHIAANKEIDEDEAAWSSVRVRLSVDEPA